MSLASKFGDKSRDDGLQTLLGASLGLMTADTREGLDAEATARLDVIRSAQTQNPEARREGYLQRIDTAGTPRPARAPGARPCSGMT